MELKATSMGKRLAQHPYHQVRMLAAGVEVSGDNHEYIIPFNQLLGVECKRGMVWGELEFQLAENKVVRLHGTEWSQTQQFWQHLMQCWQQWSQQMVEVSIDVLTELKHHILAIVQKDSWLAREDIVQLHQHIQQQFDALPLPAERFPEFFECYQLWLFCHGWLDSPESQRIVRNNQWMEQIEQRYGEFFDTVETSPLNLSQRQAVINGEPSVLVLAGAGSGKTSVLVARAAWLVMRKLALPEQIILLAFGREAANELNQRIKQRTGQTQITAKTFHALALDIIKQATNKTPKISTLESDIDKRHELLLDSWLAECSHKKASATGWRQWLTEELAWQLADGAFWEQPEIQRRIPSLLDKWLGLIRMHGGSQTEMIANADEEERARFSKRIKLLSPIVKAWKAALKEEGATDFSGLIQQACALVEKGRFISPWKHILVDEFQDISPQRSQLIALLRQQNRHSQLYVVGDDWQAIYRFAGAHIDLTTKFHQNFGVGATLVLDTTYRFDQRLGDYANTFIQQNPQQIQKSLNGVRKGDKKSVTLLPEAQLEALLDKMSGFVTREEQIFLLARYGYKRPEVLNKAETRWPNLNIQFMTIHASKGKEADYVIVYGLNAGSEGFPATDDETIIEQVLLAQKEHHPQAEERRLAYVAMTRAKKRLWLLYDQQNPCSFVDELKQLGVPIAKKP